MYSTRRINESLFFFLYVTYVPFCGHTFFVAGIVLVSARLAFGCPDGENREAGVSPARSRHCDEN